MIREFLAQITVPVDRAGFAVAGPVLGGKATSTNLPWVRDGVEMARERGRTVVQLLNDLEALARAVPVLETADLHTLNAGEPHTRGPIAMIAPGTGLGEAFLLRMPARHTDQLLTHGGSHGVSV